MEKSKVEKFIDFIITQKCTYSCEYCSQSKGETDIKKDADIEVIKAFLNFLDKIDKDYEITITGGEALLHPYFYNLIEQIKNKGFKLNLITNLSFKIEDYKKVFILLGDFLNKFDISFHLDEIKDFDFEMKKLKEIVKLKPLSTKITFLIPIYKLTKQKEDKIKTIKNIAKNFNIEFEYQHIHFFENYRKNSEIEKKYIRKKPYKAFGQLCYAGFKSAVIYENGNTYRCYSSRFLKSNYIGNIKDKNFKLFNKLKPCSMKFCTCPKPRIYNQITQNKSLYEAKIAKLINYIFLPYYLFKNITVLKSKIKQCIRNK